MTHPTDSEQDRASQGVYTELTNRPERLAWYQDMAIGMYLYWTVDAVFGMVNAHSTIGASRDYLKRYFAQMPAFFDPKAFDPRWYARLAKLCGFDYVTIAAKNHNGFCMWDTATTDFNSMNTPFGKDIVGEYVAALRENNLAVGMYFSPDDAWFQWQRGNTPARALDYANPESNPELLAYDKAQLRELLEKYEPDILCFDGYRDATRSLVEYSWRLRPDLMITRGGIITPEQERREDVRGPFEAHYTIGTQWQYKAGNDRLKTGRELIELLIDIRSRGGALLLAVGGPDADGLLPRHMDDRVREIGLWNFLNGESIRKVRPWHLPREDAVFFSWNEAEGTVYAFDTAPALDLGEWRTICLRSVRATEQTEIEVLGQSGRVLEYRPEIDPSARWTQHDRVLEISYCRAQRLYNNHKWPNPLVIKISAAEKGHID
ncbi:MAG: alpha-L-fucosidase [Chloroflexi bacterium]|nr:alpha-L-fucosidase [Chloroflexota bacterium]